MFSLDNTYSQQELREFVARVQRLLPGETAGLGGRAEDRRTGDQPAL